MDIIQVGNIIEWNSAFSKNGSYRFEILEVYKFDYQVKNLVTGNIFFISKNRVKEAYIKIDERIKLND